MQTCFLTILVILGALATKIGQIKDKNVVKWPVLSNFQGWSRSQSGRRWAAIFENSGQFDTKIYFRSGPSLEVSGI